MLFKMSHCSSKPQYNDRSDLSYPADHGQIDSIKCLLFTSTSALPIALFIVYHAVHFATPGDMLCFVL